MIAEARRIEKDEVSRRRGPGERFWNWLKGERGQTGNQNTPAAVPREQLSAVGDIKAPSSHGEERQLLDDANDLVQRGASEDALAVLDALVDRHRAFPDGYIARAAMALKMGRYDAATADYEKALALGRTDLDTRFALGTAYEKKAEHLSSKGRMKEAMELYQNAIREYKEILWKNHRYYPAHYSMGCVYARMGDSQDAIYYFKKTIEIAGENADLSRRARHNLELIREK